MISFSINLGVSKNIQRLLLLRNSSSSFSSSPAAPGLHDLNMLMNMAAFLFLSACICFSREVWASFSLAAWAILSRSLSSAVKQWFSSLHLIVNNNNKVKCNILSVAVLVHTCIITNVMHAYQFSCLSLLEGPAVSLVYLQCSHSLLELMSLKHWTFLCQSQLSQIESTLNKHGCVCIIISYAVFHICMLMSKVLLKHHRIIYLT